MRILIARLALSALIMIPSPEAAKKVQSNPDPEVMRLLQLEREMWEAWRKHDLKALTALTAKDYVSVNEFGQSTWAEVEAAFGDVVLESYTLGDMHAMRVSKDVVIVTYPAEIHGSYKTTDMSRKVAECSVWRRENGRWQNVFLHEVTVK